MAHLVPRVITSKRKVAPLVRTNSRLGRLGDTCVNNSGTAPAAAKVTAPVVNLKTAMRAQLKGLGYLGVNTGSSGAVLTAVGITGQGGVGGAVSGGAKGAAIGSAIVPGIGTAIGAVIGAVAGALIHTSQYPNWLAEDTNIIKVLQQIPAGFQGRTLPLLTPTAQQPLTLEMIWTAIIVTQNMYSYVSPNPGHSPSDMANEFNWVMAWIKSILTCMNNNPVGANLTVTVNAGNGVKFTLTFDNPGLSNTAQVTQVVIIPAYLAWCTHNNTVDTQPGHCPTDAANPVNQLVLDLMTDYQIAQVNPSAGAITPPAPPKPAPIITPAKTATVTVSTPAKATAPAASTTVTAGKAVTTATPPPAPVAVLPSPAVQAPPPIQPLAPIESTAPIPTLGVPAPQVIYEQAPAPISAGLPIWVYLAAGGVLLYLVTRNKKAA